jgi:hypothetical protein
MHLLRFATLDLESALGEWREFSMEHDGVEVGRVETSAGPSDPLLIVALVPLEGPAEVDRNGLVQVPDEPRRQGEAALQHVADMLSVATGGRRALASPSLPVAFKADNPDERAWLHAQTGLAGAEEAQPRFTVTLEARHAKALSDRLDGVTLMAEAWSNSHLTGRFHELVRLFERAFKEKRNRLVLVLADFLAARPLLAYSKTEVKRWIKRLRDPATHADQSHAIVTEARLRPVIDRMTFAAYDVLLNKRDWFNPSTARRDIWRPDSGPLTPDGREIFARQHSTGSMETQFLDRFGAYPLNLSAGLGCLGEDCWPRRGRSKTTVRHGGLRVVAAHEIDTT